MNKSYNEIREWKVVLGICIIFSLRIFGMFIILPVFGIYGMYFQGSTTFLIGVALGVYSFFQALFQIPYGWLSDKFGRKHVIILGLLFFLIGSFICLNSSSIWGIILGRSLQGSGAISSVCMALLSETISKRNRSQAMGFLGISFGISFVFAMVMSPILVHSFGIHSLFFISVIFSIICIFIIFFAIPTPISSKNGIFLDKEYKNILNVFNNFILLRFNLNIFFLHLLLMLHFIAIPAQLYSHKNFVVPYWMIYFTTILISFFIVLPISSYIERKKYEKFAIILSITLLIFSNVLCLIFIKNYFFLIFWLQIFFLVFSLFEIMLPILVSKNAPVNYKGTAMAIYSISQFLGSFIGSVLGGFILNYHSNIVVFSFELMVFFIWLLINIRCHKFG
ncbi:MAG: MFS transporter [Buchnera aphidicola (Kaburagia rhusicola ensigallis)]